GRAGVRVVAVRAGVAGRTAGDRNVPTHAIRHLVDGAGIGVIAARVFLVSLAVVATALTGLAVGIRRAGRGILVALAVLTADLTGPAVRVGGALPIVLVALVVVV